MTNVEAVGRAMTNIEAVGRAMTNIEAVGRAMTNIEAVGRAMTNIEAAGRAAVVQAEDADQTCYLTTPKHTDTGRTSSSADPIAPASCRGSYQCSNWLAYGAG